MPAGHPDRFSTGGHPRPGPGSVMSNQIDPRGPQFAAALTAVVLAIVLLSAPGTFGVALLGVPALLFALGALFGVQKTPHAVTFKHLLLPRRGAPPESGAATHPPLRPPHPPS